MEPLQVWGSEVLLGQSVEMRQASGEGWHLAILGCKTKVGAGG